MGQYRPRRHRPSSATFATVRASRSPPNRILVGPATGPTGPAPHPSLPVRPGRASGSDRLEGRRANGHRRYRLAADVDGPGHDHAAGSRAVLRRPRPPQERAVDGHAQLLRAGPRQHRLGRRRVHPRLRARRQRPGPDRRPRLRDVQRRRPGADRRSTRPRSRSCCSPRSS